MTDTLPPDLVAFSSLLDAHLCLRPKHRQPPHVRDAFNYCLCVLTSQAGKMRLVVSHLTARTLDREIETPPQPQPLAPSPQVTKTRISTTR
jgi:hypothetical protein